MGECKPEHLPRPIRFASFFAGIGGLDLGLEWAGWRCVFQCEIDAYCRKVLRRHWPQTPQAEDIRNVDPIKLQQTIGPIDAIVGGFPCQDISIAGDGGGLSGSRSGLFWELHRIIDGIRPRWVVLENVPALRSRGADDVFDALEQIGYTCGAYVVGAHSVGASHQRDRVFIVAHSHGFGRRRWGTSGKLARSKRSTSSGGTGHVLDDALNRGSVPQLRWPSRWGEPSTAGEPARLIAEPGVGESLDGIPRRLARRRSEWHRERKRRLKALGNAVVPQVAYVLGRSIRLTQTELDNG